VIINVIVADNAPTTWAQRQVSAHAKAAQTPVRYIHAPAGNISIARNACLDHVTGDYAVFIDDDEIAPTDWLENLWRDLADNDVVFGPVVARYSADAPIWITENDFHTTTLCPSKGVIKTGYAGNVMMRWHDTPWALQRFDLDLGVTGGEDTDFFNRLHHLGATLTFSPAAYVDEPVRTNRLRLGWLAKRRFRCGQSFADIAMQDMHRSVLISTALLKSIFSALCTLISALSPKYAGFWLMRCLFHIGVFARGIRPRTKRVR
jgi:succinoglycan biosynthesis protein ExoM